MRLCATWRLTVCSLLAVMCVLRLGPVGAQHQDLGAAESAEARFDIQEYRVAGNTVLPVTAVEKAVYPYLGPGRTIADVEKARQNLERAYRDAGYATVSVYIPEQQVAQGVVQLNVTEGRVDRLRVTGSRYYSQGYIRAQVPSLQEGAVPNFPAVQKDLAELNKTPDRRVVPVLRPGQKFGTTDADLNVTDSSPLHANVGLNNYYSPNTTELRLLAGLRYDNLWQRDHSFGIQFQTSPPQFDEVKVFSASYFAPLWGDASGGAYYIRSNSNVAAVGDLTVLGNGEIFGVRAVQQLRTQGSFSQSATFGADYKSFSNVVTQPGTPGIQTPIHYVPFVVSYSASFVKPAFYTSVSTGITFSLRGISASDTQFEQNRFNAASNFFIWKGDLEHTRQLLAGWSVYAKFDGQLTGQPLVSTEQYAAGGADNVRGYLQAEALGDQALHTTLEVRAPSLGPRVSPKLQDLTAYGFLDAAELALVDPLPGQQTRTTLASVGVGLRARALDTLTLRLDVGFALRPTTYTAEGEVRVQFSAAYQN